MHVLRGVEEIDDARDRLRAAVERPQRDLTGPFDIIGDVHGCASELRDPAHRLGWRIERDGDGPAVGATHPEGRTAVFVGDLVDRGPDTPGVLRLVMGMVAAGTALCVSGNHEAKLAPRAARAARSRSRTACAESLDQLAAEPPEFRAAGARLHGRADQPLRARRRPARRRARRAEGGLPRPRRRGRVRAFALYGDTTGETDEYGLPVRYPWAEEYRGRAMVVYGHTPTPTAEWVNNTICLDTGVRLRRLADRAALPGARSWCRSRPSRSGTSRSGRSPARRAAREPGDCSTSATCRAPGS